MKSFASGSHLTGHPRCVQLAANATKFVSSIRRSHAAVRAVTPAHGSGEESANDTSTVDPIVKSFTLPTGRQMRGARFQSGERMNPTIGVAMITAAMPLKPALMVPSHRRLD